MSRSSPLPTPAQARLPAKHLPSPPVRWDVVDPLLKLILTNGPLRPFAKAIGVGVVVLQKRRRTLALPKLRPGRPRVTRLTRREQEVMRARVSGRTQEEIAQECGISKAAVSIMEKRLKEKLAAKCPECKGEGLIHCGGKNCGQYENMQAQREAGNPAGHGGKHFHLCLECCGHGKVKQQ